LAWLLPGLLALLIAAYIYLALPHEREVSSLAMLIFKFAPFVLATIAIAFFPTSPRAWWTVPLIFLLFLPFFGFLVPRQLYFIRFGIQSAYELAPGADQAGLEQIFAQFYTITAILVPYFILTVAFAFRMGGGRSGQVLKIGGSGILLMLSGIEDIMFFVVNGFWPMPEVISWASHMTVRLGRPATRTEFFILCALHFLLIFLLWALPLDRWMARCRGREALPEGTRLSPSTSPE